MFKAPTTVAPTAAPTTVAPTAAPTTAAAVGTTAGKSDTEIVVMTLD